MLFHHDARDYNVAAAETAARFRGKFDDIIQNGRNRAADVYRQVMTDIPQDIIVPSHPVMFDPQPLQHALPVQSALRDTPDPPDATTPDQGPPAMAHHAAHRCGRSSRSIDRGGFAS